MSRLNRLIIKGGVLSPGELRYICECVESLGLKTISFGSRQDILLPKETETEALRRFDELQVVGKDYEQIQNIVSSYVCSDIFPSTDRKSVV